MNIPQQQIKLRTKETCPSVALKESQRLCEGSKATLRHPEMGEIRRHLSLIIASTNNQTDMQLAKLGMASRHSLVPGRDYEVEQSGLISFLHSHTDYCYCGAYSIRTDSFHSLNDDKLCFLITTIRDYRTGLSYIVQARKSDTTTNALK